MNFTHVIGFLIGLPIAFPILRYLMKPMYAPFDNGWLKIGNVGKIKSDDIGVQFKYKKQVKEAYMPEAEVEKNVWILEGHSCGARQGVSRARTWNFAMRPGSPSGRTRRTFPMSRFPASAPILGAATNGGSIKCSGQVFLCPCHLSIYDASGKVLDGPAPRPLDALPIKVSASGDVANHRHGIQGGHEVADPDRVNGTFVASPSTPAYRDRKSHRLRRRARRPQADAGQDAQRAGSRRLPLGLCVRLRAPVHFHHAGGDRHSLMFYYVPTADHAYASTQYIIHDVDYGWFLLSYHFWGSTAMVVCVVRAHVAGLSLGGLQKPREMIWLVGLALFGIVMGFGFTGYLLPWDQRAYWATTVGVEIMDKTPLVGDFMARFLKGGPTPGK